MFLLKNSWKDGRVLRKGFQNYKVLSSLLESMCQRAETDASVPQEFDIADLLTPDEWEQSTTNYGHNTLGQLFCSRVETGNVKGVCKTGKKSPQGRTQYKRI